ncbi:hypothetical protein [Massilia alkalitolerans]|uniref:hypothetical protein n=1 Tax=Massilia alkalitolerans TaxID=286638 RepID=UPI0004033BD0|nr:hypothetical protein [Massilia alkalitolerans]
MSTTSGNASRTGRLLALSLALLLASSPREASALPPPPEYVELTPDTMKKLGIEYRLYRKGERSSIYLAYPARLREKLRPRYITVLAQDRQGREQQRSRILANEEGGSLDHSFDHRQVDMAVSVEYGEPYVYASTVYGIKSVSAFITKYMKPSDLLPPPLIEYKP